MRKKNEEHFRTSLVFLPIVLLGLFLVVLLIIPGSQDSHPIALGIILILVSFFCIFDLLDFRLYWTYEEIVDHTNKGRMWRFILGKKNAVVFTRVMNRILFIPVILASLFLMAYGFYLIISFVL